MAEATTGDDPAAWALETDLDLDALNLHLPALAAAGLLGIVELDGRATAYLSQRVDDLSVPGRWVPVPNVDWHGRWREELRPVQVGAWTIAPPWLAEPDPSTIVIEPAQAFGTGHHETTTGCLAALQELRLAGRRVLDVGTGTGVLAIAAARAGGAPVHAVDTDPLAVEAAAANARVNGVTIAVQLGSVDAAPPGPYDVVVANLDTATVCSLAQALVAQLAPAGTLVVSGVSVERQGEAVAALEAAGLVLWVRPGREWVVLVGSRRVS